MRNNILFLLMMVFLVTACTKKTDSVFDQSPDERLSATLSALESKLIGAQYGWIGKLEPKAGGPFGFYFEFKADNRVKMLSDFDRSTATALKESSWRLKGLQQPSLIFDTYSYLHLYSDPDPNVAGGTAGQGYQSDFEFSYDPSTAQTDTIKLTGRFNGSKLTLIRATQQQQTDYLNGSLARGYDFHNLSALSTYNYQGASGDWGVGGKVFNYWKRFTIGGTTYEIDEDTFDPINRSVRFSWYSSTGVKSSFTTGYTFGPGRVILAKPFTAGSTVVNEFTNLVWDDAAKTLTANINSSNTTTTFAGATAPLYYDTTAFTTFRNFAATITYWTSDFGFYRNGVFNAFAIDTLTATTTAGKNTYYYTIYWPAYGSNYDLFAPVFLNPAQTGLTLVYGFAAINNNAANPIVKNGIANFNFGGTVGTGLPTTGAWANTQNQFRSSAGYYFIKLANGDYDQVAVSDAKTWMTWNQ